MNFKISAMVVAAAMLAACGGGSGDSSGGGAGGGSSFADVLSDFEANTAFDDVETELASFASLTSGGSASYSGETAVYLDVSALDDEFESPDDLPTPDLLGQLSVQTTFAGSTGTLSGTMSDFVDSDNNAKTGSLALEDGRFFDDGEGEASFISLLSGSLSGSGAGSQSYNGIAAGGITSDGDLVGIGFESGITSLDPSDLVEGGLTDDEVSDLDIDDEPDFIMVFIGTED